jgi:hypothetical protein
MYETEKRVIEQAEQLAAHVVPKLADGAENDPSAIAGIRCAISERESAQNRLSPVYEALRSRVVADPIQSALLPRAFRALLLLESQKDSLLYDLHRLQTKAVGQRLKCAEEMFKNVIDCHRSDQHAPHGKNTGT